MTDRNVVYILACMIYHFASVFFITQFVVCPRMAKKGELGRIFTI